MLNIVEAIFGDNNLKKFEALSKSLAGCADSCAALTSQACAAQSGADPEDFLGELCEAKLEVVTFDTTYRLYYMCFLF